MMQAMGVDNFYKAKWAALGKEIMNPIGCADCHEPENMNLHISRPALIEAFQRQGKDITKATQQEMRSLVCAQCHVEYYFKGDGKYLTFPWDKGSTVEDMEAYYDEVGFADYTHKLSRAPILKAQHPDYEISQMGIHAQRGVSYADCHMPYKSEGGVKYSDHHMIAALAGVVFCLVLSLVVESHCGDRIVCLSDYTYTVFLLSYFPQMFIRGPIAHALPEVNQYVLSVVSVVVGFILPIALGLFYRKVLDKNSVTRFVGLLIGI